MQVKIFTQHDRFRFKFSEALAALEKEVGEWSAANPNINIINIKQSFAASIGPKQVVISIWYEEQVQQ